MRAKCTIEVDISVVCNDAAAMKIGYACGYGRRPLFCFNGNKRKCYASQNDPNIIHLALGTELSRPTPMINFLVKCPQDIKKLPLVN